jgi:uncharacterized protein involved in type VI secretion and phage assembly
MSMKHLLNQIRLQAQLAESNRAAPRMCLVSSYDPSSYCAKVMVQPENTESGWLSVASMWVGNGWGMFSPPVPGTMVNVHFQEDDFQSGYICAAFYNDEERPLAVPAGELWMQHKNGAFLKLQNDGSATFSDGAGATVRLNGDGTITSAATKWDHTGPVNITGDVTITGNEKVNGNIVASQDISDHNTKSMAGMRTTFNSHTHPENGTGGGTTSAPNQNM